MIIDSNLVLIDHLTKTEIGEAGKNMSRAVPLTSFLEPGRQGPIPIVIQLSDGLVENETITFKLFQGDEYADAETNTEIKDGWEEISSVTASGPMKKGCRIGWRFLPRSATKQWLRLQVGDSTDSTDSSSSSREATDSTDSTDSNGSSREATDSTDSNGSSREANGSSREANGSSHKATDLNVFAAIVREDLFEYDKLLYINAGRNEWEAKEAALSTKE